jgi:hypothetical protein
MSFERVDDGRVCGEGCCGSILGSAELTLHPTRDNRRYRRPGLGKRPECPSPRPQRRHAGVRQCRTPTDRQGVSATNLRSTDQFLDEPCLADTGWAADDHHPPRTLACVRQPTAKELQFLAPPDEPITPADHVRSIAALL